MSPYQHKVDANQSALFELWRACGATVVDFSDSRRAGCDCLVVFQGEKYIVEIKDGPGKRLTDSERLTQDELLGAGACLHVVRSEQDALRLIGRGSI